MLKQINLCCHGEFSLHIRQNTTSWEKITRKDFAPLVLNDKQSFLIWDGLDCRECSCTSDNNFKLCIRNIYLSYKYLAKCPPPLTEAHPFKPKSPYNNFKFFYSPSSSVDHRLVLFLHSFISLKPNLNGFLLMSG